MQQQPPGHHCEIISEVNIKGGVGKTTSAIFLGFGLAEQGYRVLLIDMDPQDNSTYTVTGKMNEGKDGTLYEVLREEKPRPAGEIVIKTAHPNLFILPGTLMLSSTEIELISTQLREFRLKSALEPLRQYFHFIIIDTPPNLGLLTVNSLVACTRVIIPVTTKVYGLVGINILLNTLSILRGKFSTFGVTLPILGVLVNQVRLPWTNNSRERYQQLQEIFGDKIFEAFVPLNEKIEESNDQEKSGYQFAPDARGVQAYRAIVQEVIARVSQ